MMNERILVIDGTPARALVIAASARSTPQTSHSCVDA